MNVSKEIVYESSRCAQRSRRPDSVFIHESLGANTSSTLTGGVTTTVTTAGSATSPSTYSPRDSSHITHIQTPPILDVSEEPTAGEQPSQDPVANSRNQLKEGVNDIEFTIEFPSHLSKDQQPSPSREEHPYSLPTGPIKSASGDSSITYILSAALVMSRRDILVNNHVCASIPFQVQNWHDVIDWRRSEDHSYHGKRRDKIEFQFEVPKQLDLRRLQELQFGFKGSWRTLQDNLKVREIEYYIVEEEQQTLAMRTAPVIIMSIISTSAVHDCSGYDMPTNTWGHLRAAARLQIPQPNTVLETMAMPWPHTLSISHKLRVIIKFDNTLSKERDLQLSFPISMHPTLNEDGSPVHLDVYHAHRTRRRRRGGHAMYGINNRQAGEDGASDDEDVPLPMYADREGTLLLMVGQEAHELSVDDEVDALGMTMGYPDEIIPYSPSEASPTTPFDSFSPMTLPVQTGEQHAWALPGRRSSLVPSPSARPADLTSAPRRPLSMQVYNRALPPPYIMSSPTEEVSGSTLVPRSPPQPPSQPDTPSLETSEQPESADEDAIAATTSSMTTEAPEQIMDDDNRRRAVGKGKARARDVGEALSVQIASSSSSSSSPYTRSGFSTDAGSSRPVPCPLPSPPYEIQEETLGYSGAGRYVRTLNALPSMLSSSSSSSPSDASESSESSPSSPDHEVQHKELTPDPRPTGDTNTEQDAGCTSSCSVAR